MTQRANIPSPDPMPDDVPPVPQPPKIPPPPSPAETPPIDDPGRKREPPVRDPPPDEKPNPQRFQEMPDYFGPVMSSGRTHASYCASLT